MATLTVVGVVSGELFGEQLHVLRMFEELPL